MAQDGTLRYGDETGETIDRFKAEDRLRGEAVAWRPIVSGLAHYPLVTQNGVCARLIRAAPDVAGVAVHGHRGEEWTLVLTGSYTDASGTYGPGDVQTTTPDIEHQPTADPGPVCINLAVTDAPLVFRGLLPKIVGRLFGF